MNDLLSAPSAELGSLLAAAREMAGLSRAELARNLGVSWETVRHAESGRDPRHSTLASYLVALPFLSPRALLLGDAAAPPLAHPAVWDFHERHFGFAIDKLIHEIRIEADGRRSHHVEVFGARWTRSRGDDPLRRADLMRSLFLGSGEVLRKLHVEPEDLEAGRMLIQDGETVHEFLFARRKSQDIGYRWIQERPAPQQEPALQCEPDELARTAEAVASDIGYPVRKLELALQLGAGTPPLAVAFFVAPDMSVPAQGAIALARAMYPAGLRLDWDPARRRLHVVVPHPLPNLRHGLAWLPASEAPASFLPLGTTPRLRGARVGALATHSHASPTPGRQVRCARENAGWSARELARRMGVSAATVLSVEADDDSRVSTLRRVLEALPQLQPEDLFAALPPRSSNRELSSEEIWLYYRNVVGLHAAEATRTLTLTPNGDGSEAIGTRALVRVHGGPHDVIVKDGISRGAHGRFGPVYLEQRGREGREELRVRWIRSAGETPEFQLHVPATLAGQGVSFERKDRKELAYKMKKEQSDRSIGPAYECFVPLTKLTMLVRFPRGYWPLEIGAFVRAGVNVTNPRWPDLTKSLHEGRLRLDSTRPAPGRIGEVRLEVDKPLLGFRYSITWKAP